MGILKDAGINWVMGIFWGMCDVTVTETGKGSDGSWGPWGLGVRRQTASNEGPQVQPGALTGADPPKW